MNIVLGIKETIGFVVLIFLIGCASVPYTNRKQFVTVSAQEESAMGLQAYQDVLKKEKISTDANATAMVKRVGGRIAAVAERPDFKWEFNLIDNPKVPNAFCLPGGKVAVYSGLLPTTKDEAGLAVVMSHEVAHALARHGAERMSQGQLVGLVEQAAVAAGVIKTQVGLQAFEMAYGIGAGLPHGRKQESEADKIGLILMAKAGYDPRAAIPFWQRMSQLGGDKPPQFLSTHPSDETRIKQIEQWLPEVLKYYKQ